MNKPDKNVVVAVIVHEVDDVLRRHFVSPSTVLWPACRSLSVDPALITARDIGRLAPLVGSLVERVTDRENAQSVVAELGELAR